VTVKRKYDISNFKIITKHVTYTNLNKSEQCTMIMTCPVDGDGSMGIQFYEV